MTFVVDGTNGNQFPTWTTATRPTGTALSNGLTGYNTTTAQLEIYSTKYSTWNNVGTPGNTYPASYIEIGRAHV